ncbi:MAG: hypothetical protein GY820_39705 [Gammaproteobacteria bacterium]|nr:hypothetical protein [Gammaproteobacteria bacterium]
MTKATATQIELDHNVIVDAKAEMYTRGNKNNTYNWYPIPIEWIDTIAVTRRARR